MLELLAPAGSMEALRAAVCNGANAVYLGTDSFNARMGARNFTVNDLQQAIVYCHVRGVKVYLTLNTLISDREMEKAAELIRSAAVFGIDAFIVQDLGIIRLCREIAPEVPLHGSTQMTIHSLEGVRAAEAMGIRRVVLSRELPAAEIAEICKHTTVQIEIFAHGALCMCYSGQCYLSSVIGQRSGNRGHCAQPCRLPYGYGRFESARYPLSLKDNCLIEYIPEIEKMGVACLKLEGRMKRPEYVAIVTRAYRTALDGGRITVSDMRQLEQAFSRQGFTQGYFTGKTGEQMFGTRQSTEDASDLFASARATYEQGDVQRVPIRFYAMIRSGEPAQLALEDDVGNVCKTVGPTPQIANVRALTQEELEKQLSKTGGTPYRVEAVKSILDPGLMLPLSSINAMRRDLIAELTARRGRVPLAHVNAYNEPARCDGLAGEPLMTVYVQKVQQITPRLLRMTPAILYVPLAELMDNPDLPQRLSVETQLVAVLPRIIWGKEESGVLRQLQTAYEMGVRQVLVGNLGQIAMAKKAGFGVRGDFGLNIFNSRSMRAVHDMGLESQLLSFEMSVPQLRDVSKDIPAEVMVYGRLPLMLTENCIMKNRTGTCTCQTTSVRLVDRKGEEFPVIHDAGTCRNVVLNGKKMYVLDKLQAFRGIGVWALRLQFTTENPGEVDKVLSDYQSGGSFDAGSYTRGLYNRGVE